MEEVLIDDNMVFDIDNLKGFLNDTSSFGFIAKENNKIIGFAYCYTLLRPDGKTMFYLHSTKTNAFCLGIILCNVSRSFDYLIYPYYPAYTS